MVTMPPAGRASRRPAEGRTHGCLPSPSPREQVDTSSTRTRSAKTRAAKTTAPAVEAASGQTAPSPTLAEIANDMSGDTSGDGTDSTTESLETFGPIEYF